MNWLILFSAAIGVWFALPFGAKKLQILHLRRRCKVRRLIVLTFDDGPGPRLTKKLLDALKSRKALATFFVIGQKVDASRDDLEEMLRRGHEIGCHSYRHLHPWMRNPISVFRDIQDGFHALRHIGTCHLFRAPHGKTTLASLLHVALLGCKQSWWTIDSTDTWESPRRVGQIVDQVRREGGGVVLLHDMDRPGHPEREQFVLDLTRALLELAETENFRICTLGEVLKA